ncbi:MAG TPA: glycosyltransferase [Verrucomicrobiae bacterium]|nr:glycosyltransferase [Verrucomicrobiae bacterium]
MKRKTIIFDATEAVNPQRRGVGVQTRSWLEVAPFTDYPHLQFVLASKATPGQESLHVNASNVKQITHEARTEEAFIDYLYSLNGDLLFFPLASRQYVRESKAKMVGVDYGMEDLYCRNYIAPLSATEFMEWHEYAMQHFDSIITVSKTSQRDLAWFFPEYKDKVQVVYPGSVKTGTALEEDMPEVLRGTPYFLVIGYEHKKNITRIAVAFDAFKQKTGSRTKLAIAGNPGFGGEEIDSHINSLASAGDIVRLGYVPAPQKQLLMQHCHAVIALAIYEGFGISALEGMEAGKIVLVSNNGSLKEVVGNAGYTANPFSITSITKQLIFIDGLNDNPKKKYVSNRLAVFDQKLQTKKLLQHLSKIVA